MKKRQPTGHNKEEGMKLGKDILVAPGADTNFQAPPIPKAPMRDNRSPNEFKQIPMGHSSAEVMANALNMLVGESKRRTRSLSKH